MTVDGLREFGLEGMNDEEIDAFLSNRRWGVLGLPTEEVPYLLPLSYGFDGGDRLYFTYLRGPDSQKATLSERAETAAFLVFAVDTLYNWESVLLEGQLTTVPESEWDNLADVLDDVWRPDVLESAVDVGDIDVYELSIDDRNGIKHQGLPPGFDPDT